MVALHLPSHVVARRAARRRPVLPPPGARRRPGRAGPLLLATDLSFTAHELGTAAVALAQQLGSALWLVPAPGSPGAGEALDEEARRLGWDGAAEVHPLGEPLAGPDQLAALATELAAQLVLLPAPAQLPPARRDTLERLVQACARPVLAVRDAAPFRAWAQGVRPLKVVLGVDSSAPCRAALSWGALLARLGAVEVVAVHVYWPADALAQRGLPHPTHFGEVRPELLEALERDVAAQVAPLAARVPLRVRLVAGCGRVVDPLVEAAEQEHADLLVVGTHRRRGVAKLWSVSRLALRLAPMAVLCVPTRAGVAGEANPAAPVRSLLVATDLSEEGNRAVPHAFSLLAPGGTAHLVHVGPPEPSREESRQRFRQLGALVPEGVRAQGLHAQCEVLEGKGSVGEALACAAERHAVDAVLLVAGGRPGLRRGRSGPVLEQLLQHCRRPVLVLHPPPEG